MSEAQAISLYQPLLYSIAMSIVGSARDAEDLVQDTFMKWLAKGPQKVENTRAYLVQAVRNNSIKYMQAFQQRKIDLLDQIPDNLAGKFQHNLEQIDLDVDLKRAVDHLQHKLEPLEKGVFILREVFQLEYDEIQEIFEKRKDHCRQLLRRAKQKLKNEETITSGGDNSLWKHLTQAFHHDKLSELIQHLKEEIL